MTEYPARIDGQPVTLVVGSDGIVVAGRGFPWHEVDALDDDGTRIVLTIARGIAGTPATIEITHLGTRRDAAAREMRERRGVARRRSLGQGDLVPLASFTARDEERVIDVEVFPHGIVLELRGGSAVFVARGLIADVKREGYRFTCALRHGGPISVAGLGARSDEFALAVSRMLAEGSIAGHPDWIDGWGMESADAVREIAARGRPEEVQVLLETCGRVRAGIYTEGGAQEVPFLLGVGPGGAVLEGMGDEARATFVFATDDLDRVNAALLTICFRRDLLSLPEEDLGQWAAAIRTQPEVAWLRSALVARIIHAEGWESRLRAAIAPDPP